MVNAPSGLGIAIDGRHGRVLHAFADAAGGGQHEGQLARRAARLRKFGIDLGQHEAVGAARKAGARQAFILKNIDAQCGPVPAPGFNVTV